MHEGTELVTRSLQSETFREFERRVEEQAASLKADHDAGRFDSPTFATGMELEVYGVDGNGQLVTLPKSLFGDDCDKELGRHNAEFQTDPDVLDEAGLESQATQLRERFRRVSAAAAEHGVTVVLDAMWSVPPAEGTVSYLSATERHDGVSVAANMTPSPRYYALDNHILQEAGGTVPVSVPGADVEFPSILMESLTSSVQPHVQVPSAEQFPQYHNLALRTLGPVLALTTNSPFLPADLYEGSDPERVVRETYHELRIPVFEQSINASWEKVRFPQDVAATTDLVDALVADATAAPFLREWIEGDTARESFADQYWEIDHKRGTFWRWMRAVFGGRPVGGGDEWSVRIEYRPIPTQPTVDDNLAVQWLVTGLLRGLVVTDHPLTDLDQGRARECFYDVVASGLDADLAWITADGESTTEPAVVVPELFELARRGLDEQGVASAKRERFLGLLEARWDAGLTPSEWKRRVVSARLEAGDSFVEAIERMQAEYVRRAGDTDPFATWDEPEAVAR
jgi:hypothetical protein